MSFFFQNVVLQKYKRNPIQIQLKLELIAQQICKVTFLWNLIIQNLGNLASCGKTSWKKYC